MTDLSAPSRPTVPTVWLLAAPLDVLEANPDALMSYGNVRAIFRARESASRDPEAALSRIYETMSKAVRPGDYIAWMGGDTLIAILAGVVMEQLGVEHWNWLRYIGRNEYQVIPIRPDKITT